MLCEHCKMREATVKYVEVIGGVKNEHNLCGYCAAKLDIGQYSALFEGEISLGKLLSGLMGLQNAEKNEGKYAGVVCPTCKTTYEEFASGSRFGCADCYSVFGPLLGENIRHLQGSEKHVGKRPVRYRETEAPVSGEPVRENSCEKGEDPGSTLTGEERLRLLQARLKDALRREEYEDAAALRDEIREIKKETEITRETEQNG